MTARPANTVLAAHLDGETILLEIDAKAYYRLNETAQTIWRALEAGGTRDDVVSRLTQVFDVAEQTARAELDRFIADLRARGLVSDT